MQPRAHLLTQIIQVGGIAMHENPVRAGGHTVDYRLFPCDGDAHPRALVAIDVEPTVLPTGERMHFLSWCRELCRLDIDGLTGGVQPLLLRETVFAHEALEGRFSMTDGDQLRTDVTVGADQHGVAVHVVQ